MNRRTLQRTKLKALAKPLQTELTPSSTTLAESRSVYPRLVNDIRLSEMFGYSRASFQLWRCEGSGPPYFKRAGRVLYDPNEVEAWFRAGRIDSEAADQAAN